MRCILNFNKYKKVADMLNILNWVNVSELIDINVLCFVFKIVNRLVPEYLCDNVQRSCDLHSHDTRVKNQLYVQTYNNVNTKGFIFKQGFIKFNLLKEEIKGSKTLKGFKRQLITSLRDGVRLD